MTDQMNERLTDQPTDPVVERSVDGTDASATTGPLGKTARLVPEISRYFVAVPQHGTTNASILVFEVPGLDAPTVG